MILKIGFARVDITPVESVPLAGYGNTSKRMSQDILDPLYTTCLAFTDEAGQTALIFTSDLISAHGPLTAACRETISQETGVPKEHIQLASTHTHSAPDTRNLDVPSIPRYREQFRLATLEAAKQALADRRPAKLSCARVKIPGMNFVRRYLLSDGDSLSDNYNGHRAADIVAHETEADHEMQVVRVTRDGGKDLMLCNWQGHCTLTGGLKKTDVSADFPIYFRRVIEQETGALCAYFTGAAGNLNLKSRIASENPTLTPAEFGEKVASYVLGLRKAEYRPLKTGPVKVEHLLRETKINHKTDVMKPQAEEIAKIWKETNDPVLCRIEGEKYGIHSPYHANAMLARCNMPQSVPIELNTVSVGDLSFSVSSYEMFDTNALSVKRNSPFPMTFILTCANDQNAYIPSAFAFLHAGYENDTCRFEPGTGEILQEALIAMLKKMKAD